MPKAPITSGMRKEWRACPRQVFFKHVAGIDSGKPRKGLVVWKALHAGIEWAWSQQSTPAQAATVATSAYNAMAVQERLTLGDGAESQVYGYVLGYCHRWRGEKSHSFSVPQAGPVNGIDSGDGVWIVENKLVQDLEDDDAIGWSVRINDKLTAILAYLTGKVNVRGVRYREIVKTKTRLRKDETVPLYASRLGEQYTSSEAANLFRETMVTWGRNELDLAASWRAKANVEIAAQLEVKDFGKWPCNPSSCIGPYAPCDFIKLCANGRDKERQFIVTKEASDGGEYRRKIWGGKEAGMGGHHPGLSREADLPTL